MRQGRKILALCLALAVGTVGTSLIAASQTQAAAKPGRAESGSKARNGMHQLTGYVTALDQNTITVEKRGKQPRSVVFTKHADMKSTGAVVKGARVTVYYRDEGGRSMAHRVVLKPLRSRTASAK
jgi:sRNA-binding regulator protein Hfq